MPLLTDLIMGMPGESYESWLENIENVFVQDITNMDVYYLQLLVLFESVSLFNYLPSFFF